MCSAESFREIHGFVGTRINWMWVRARPLGALWFVFPEARADGPFSSSSTDIVYLATTAIKYTRVCDVEYLGIPTIACLDSSQERLEKEVLSQTGPTICHG